MEKEKITSEAQSLYNDIDKCIDKIISARTQHDPQLEGKALFQMEGLMVCTQQFLAWLMEQIDDSDNAKIVRIEKGFINSATIDGINQVLEPTTVYTVLDRNQTLVKTVYKDIREAAREAERLLDIDVLEVAYKENPDSFKSAFVGAENIAALLNNGLEQMEGESEKNKINL